MSDNAPERIWAWFFTDKHRDDVMQGGWDDKPDRKTTEYISLAAHQAELDKLREACAAMWTDIPCEGGTAVKAVNDYSHRIRSLDINAAIGGE